MLLHGLIYLIVGGAAFLTLGIVLANYEAARAKQARREMRERARRYVRR